MNTNSKPIESKTLKKNCANGALAFALCICIALIPDFSIAAGIARTITIDGNMDDWHDTGATPFSPAGDITTNSGQFATDSDGREPYGTSAAYADLDAFGGKLTSTGRDLKVFAYTWDEDNLYLYVERFASDSNVTDWWFYLDTNNDGDMDDGEHVLRVKWSGSTGATSIQMYDYIAVAGSGDPLVNPDYVDSPTDTLGFGIADGYDMPGDIENEVDLATPPNSEDGGEPVSGVEMETFISWDNVFGVANSSPASIGFHVSSSNGSNLPDNIIDNMDGPGGGAGLVFYDLAVTKTVDNATPGSLATIVYTITVENVDNLDASADDAAGVALSDIIPSQLSYVSHVASGTTTYTDSEPDGDLDLWTVGALAEGATETLTITATTPFVISPTGPLTNTADTLLNNENDTNLLNNSDSVDITIYPSPDLVAVKTSVPGDGSSANPGDIITYVVTVTENNGVAAVNVSFEDSMSRYTALLMDKNGNPGEPFVFTANATGLVMPSPQATYYDKNDVIITPATTGYDGDVKRFVIDFSANDMNASSSFTIEYDAQIEN